MWSRLGIYIIDRLKKSLFYCQAKSDGPNIHPKSHSSPCDCAPSDMKPCWSTGSWNASVEISKSVSGRTLICEVLEGASLFGPCWFMTWSIFST